MPIHFALIGDMPYDARHEREFANVMKGIDSANLAFVVHNGDFWWDGAAWTEKAGGHPRVATRPSSIVWVWLRTSTPPHLRCRRQRVGRLSQAARLLSSTMASQMFFSGDESLGRRTMRLARQSADPRFAKFRENARWTHGEVLFVTLHVIGSNNNRGRTRKWTPSTTSGPRRTSTG